LWFAIAVILCDSTEKRGDVNARGRGSYFNERL